MAGEVRKENLLLLSNVNARLTVGCFKPPLGLLAERYMPF
jgi:hypothetical protein